MLNSSPPSPVPSSPAPSSPVPPVSAARILIVEDEVLIAEDLRRKLHLMGYDVLEVVTTGEQAVQFAGQYHPNLVLMDIHLPTEMSGIQAAYTIWEMYDIPIVYLTAYADEATLNQAKATGPFGYILKPFRDWELRTHIETALYKYQQEHKVRESEERFRQMFEQMAVGFSLANVEGHFIRVNERFCRMLGYSREELLACDFQSITYSPDLPADLALTRRVFAGEIDSFSMEKRYVRKDGSLVWVNLTVALARDVQNEPLYTISVIEDISLRKQTEDALQRSQAELQALNAVLRERLAFESLVTALSARFVNLRLEAVDDEISAALGHIAVALSVEHASLFEFALDAEKRPIFQETHTCTQNLDSSWRKRINTMKNLPWAVSKLLNGEVVCFARVDELPAEASVDKELIQSLGTKSSVVLPLRIGEQVRGALVLSALHTERSWPESLLRQLELMGQVFYNALGRAQAEKDLRLSEERYRQMFEGNQAVQMLIDPQDGAIVSVNPAAVKYYGYDRQTLQSMKITQINMLSDEQLFDELQRARDARQTYFNFHHRLASGEVRDVEVFSAPVQTSNKTLLYSIIFDITVRKRVEKERQRLLDELSQQSQQIYEIMDTVPEGMLLLEAGGQVLLANRVGQADLQSLANAQVGDTICSLGDRSLVELLEPPAQGLWHEVQAGRRIFEVIARQVPGSQDDGRWVMVLRDVSREREVQQGIQQQERLAAVGQLAAGIAHDFNNVLAVIMLYADLMLRRPNLDVDLRERIATISQQGRRAAQLVQQVLDFSRRAVLERRPMDLLPFVKEQVRLLERTLPENILVRLDVKDEQFMINADPTRLQQALMNLAVNARDAMPLGGDLCVRIVHLPPGECFTCLTCGKIVDGDWVQISVQDTGNGISPEDMPHIFEPFFTTKGPGRGAGLGLAQVYGIVLQHDGHLTVETQVGQGSVFSLYLPALPADAPHLKQHDSGIMFRGNRQRLLVVEDEPATRQALVESLAMLNYEVQAVNNGQLALDYLGREGSVPPDERVSLVISDVIMPEMGGIDLYHILRQQGSSLPVILISGHPLESEMEKLADRVNLAWMSKPFSLRKLSQLAFEALRE